ncbi:MAG: hypothetical protein A2511_12220 [Deltaproteobacteria bacterium RIFOXYD12_FULL_50_9]|nr:MAG: hypothetical protein A2511_12220 [Deltaproteobacteria bacterium RIFOXYD12_FULL_50_9]
MRIVAKQLFVLIFSFALLYAVIWCFTYIVYPTTRNYLDTYQDAVYFSNDKPEYYLYGRGAGLVVRGRGLLAENVSNIVVTGASTSVEGFRPPVMQKYITNGIVHNLSIGASNMTQVGQVVDLVLEATPEDKRNNLHFIVGVSYVLLRPDSEMWPGGVTNVETEMLKYGMYKSKGESRFRSAHYKYFISFLRPILIVDELFRRVVTDHLFKTIWYINNKWLRPMQFLISDNLNRVSVSEEYKVYVDREMHRRMGSVNDEIGDEQFERLIDISKKVHQSSAKLTVVDLPLAKWHMLKSKHFASYQKNKMHFFERLKEIGTVNIIDMQYMNNDDDFYDFAHPKPQTSVQWSSYLGEILSKMKY